jgi:hypothetical protein
MPEKPASLYTRLGGYDAIAAVVDDLLPRLREDSLLGRFGRAREASIQTIANASWRSISSLQPQEARRSIWGAT